VTEQQVTAGRERFVQASHQCSRHVRTEINRDVLAHDEVLRAVGGHRRLLQVAELECHPALNRVVKVERFAVAPEILIEQPAFDVAHRTCRVDATPRLFERLRVEIGPDDLDRPVGTRAKHPHVVECERDGISLLTARAAGAPDAKPLGRRRGALRHQRRNDVFAQEIELGSISEEASLGDRDEIQQVTQLGFDDARYFTAKPVVILVFALQAELLHPRRHRGRQRCALTVIETEAAALLNQIANRDERG
jgi:hypothetical protein